MKSIWMLCCSSSRHSRIRGSDPTPHSSPTALPRRFCESAVCLLSSRSRTSFSARPRLNATRSACVLHVKRSALAVTTKKVWHGFAELPPVGNSLPGYEATNWFGIVAPAKTPAQVVEMLNGAITSCLAEPNISTKLAGLGGDAIVNSPAEFGKLIADETDKWSRVVRIANIKAG